MQLLRLRQLKEDPRQLIHMAWRLGGFSIKLGSAASTTGNAAAKGTTWTGDAGTGEEAVLEAELVWKVVLMLGEEVEQVVKKAPPSSSW